MKYKVILLPLAGKEIKEAALWYNERQEGLGKRFTKHVRDKVSFIKNNPKAFNIRYDDVRTASISIFPFMIHYRVDEKKRIVIISAVLHTSRNPGIWEER